MILVAVTQRVVVDTRTQERRDSLDQRWSPFLRRCGIAPLLLPNDAAAAAELLERVAPAGAILTGGGDLAILGGDAPERDAVEALLLAWAEQGGRPALGICRGLQAMLARHGGRLERIEGHVARPHAVTLAGGGTRPVNSFHDFGARDCPMPLLPVARAEDGTLEALRHQSLPLLGLMWHPERTDPFDEADIAMIRDLFHKGALPCAL